MVIKQTHMRQLPPIYIKEGNPQDAPIKLYEAKAAMSLSLQFLHDVKRDNPLAVYNKEISDVYFSLRNLLEKYRDVKI